MKKILILFIILIPLITAAQTDINYLRLKDSLKMGSKVVKKISNNSTSSTKDTTALITEAAAKQYADAIAGSAGVDTAAGDLRWTKLQRFYDSLTATRTAINGKQTYQTNYTTTYALSNDLQDSIKRRWDSTYIKNNYQPLENQRLSTTSNVQFARGYFYSTTSSPLVAYGNSTSPNDGKAAAYFSGMGADGEIIRVTSSYSSAITARIDNATSNRYFFRGTDGSNNTKFNINSYGVITDGSYQATPIADNYIYSSSNWNTAYGWGNHALQGYATRSQVTTSRDSIQTNINNHISNTSNPHAVTKAQVGLGNVPNTDATNASNITTGTIDTARTLNSGVTAGSYGGSSAIPIITVDRKGRVITASTATVTSGFNPNADTTVTANYTCTARDAGRNIYVNSSSSVTISLPQDSDASIAYTLPQNQKTITVWQQGTGSVVIAAGTGATVNVMDGASTIIGRYGAATLVKQAANTWYGAGALK